MAVVATCAFDQWQKDVFFNAAEEVQESADVMESVYRMWMRDRAVGIKSDISDELRRELQTALGTAKWQVEEFERAVNASYRDCSRNDGRIARHGQFVAAIQSQITRVEKSLTDLLIKEGKQPLRWVQLDDEERADLAMFLSSVPQTMQESTDKLTIVDTYPTPPAKPEWANGFKETSAVSDDSRYITNSEENEITKIRWTDFDKGMRINRQSRTWSSPDISEWRIAISDGKNAEQTFKTRIAPTSHVSNFHSLMNNVGKPAKSKWPRNIFQRERSGEHFHLKNRISSFVDLKRFPWLPQGRNDSNAKPIGCNENLEVSHIQQFCGRVGGFKKQYFTQFSGFSLSIRITLLLIFILFLFVPFVFYSN